MAHLVESRAQDLDGLGLRKRVECFHEFRVTRSLHGGAVEFLLDGPQIFGDARDSQMKFVHVFVGHSVCHLNISSPTLSE